MAKQTMSVTPGSGETLHLQEDADGDLLQGFTEVIAGTNTPFPGDAANGKDVDVTRLPALPAGTNNIGDVDIASALPAGDNNIGNVDLASAIPAGTNNIGDVDIASLPNEGQQTMANSISVAVASDQSAVPVKDTGAFAAPANVSVTTSAAELDAANSARKGIWIENVDSVDTVYWGTTSGVTTSNGMPIYPNERVFIPTTSAIYLIGAAAADVRWSEMT